MSLERVLKALMNLGLSQTDAEIYVYLATEGPQEVRNIAENLRLSRQQLGSSLKSLQKKKIIILSLEYSARFSALPFEKTMALLIEAKREESQRIEQNKEEILSEWHSRIIGNSAE
jgi:sugar-specific transcriptional regulator TrmB